MGDRELSPRGLGRLSHQEWTGKEGLRADGRFYPYRDYKGFWTIGMGHLIKPGEDFSRGLSPDEVVALRHRDLAGTYKAIREGVTRELTQPEFDALVIAGHNLGADFFNPKHSHPIAALNAGDLEGFSSASCDGHCLSRGKPAHLQDWNRSGEPPVFDPGLYARRRQEGVWFLEPPEAEPVTVAALFDLSGLVGDDGAERVG